MAPELSGMMRNAPHPIDIHRVELTYINLYHIGGYIFEKRTKGRQDMKNCVNLRGVDPNNGP